MLNLQGEYGFKSHLGLGFFFRVYFRLTFNIIVIIVVSSLTKFMLKQKFQKSSKRPFT